MRALITAGWLCLALGVWVAGMVWRGPVFPWAVTVHSVTRPAAVQGSTASTPGLLQGVPGSGSRVPGLQPETTNQRPETLRLTVTRACPGIDGLAVGDAVRFDRYGLLAPSAGSTLDLPAGVDPTALQFVPYGGGCPHAGEIRITRAAPAPAVPGESQPAR